MRGKAGSGATEAVSLRITPARAGKRSGRRCPECFWWDHPRACGEKWHTCPTRSGLRGSPPRVRGKGQLKPAVRQYPRITPARAGKRLQISVVSTAVRDHPRACGEKNVLPPGQLARAGSPPRMRGKGGASRSSWPPAGITPAHAGKRARTWALIPRGRDHPRACGEKSGVILPLRLESGLPPRMRGKERDRVSGQLETGITPAHAGKSNCSRL